MGPAKELILWGFHPLHGGVPLKLGAPNEQAQRRREGWTTAIYAIGEKPMGLALEAANAADDAYGAELRRLFGKRAGDVRYTARGAGEPGSALRLLHDTKLAADRVAYP